MINSVEEYLSQLKDELSGCDPATIQNALADSEEHLQTALESNPDLQSVIEEYGTPVELAASYRELDGGVCPPVGPVTAGYKAARISRTRTYSVIWIIVGAIVALVSCGLLVAGGGILWADSALTDDNGYFMSDTLHMTTGSYAIISEPAEIELGISRAFDLGILGAFKGEIENNKPNGTIFVGVAREEDLASYLENVPREKITDLRIERAEWDHESIPGETQPAPPTMQTFWAQSAYGPDTQSFDWEPETGTWVFVIMNEDGSAGIDVNTKIGAAVPWLFGAGIVLLIVGFLLLAAGSVVIILAMLKFRKAGATEDQLTMKA